MSNFLYKENKLHAENVDLETLAKEYGTPLYCYSTEQIADNFHSWQSALKKITSEDNFTICYACKANSSTAILKMLKKLGSGADVVSIGEIKRTERAGIKATKIVFSGVGKTDKELSYAIDKELMMINIESESEFNRIVQITSEKKKNANISFRINTNTDAKTHKKITTGLSENKFGLDPETALKLYKKAKDIEHISATGISIHIGSQILDLPPFKEAFTFLAEFINKLKDQGNVIDKVSLGGGVGITYKDEKTIDLNQYAELIKDIILPLGVHVIVEPGRSILGDAGIILTRAIHKKTTTNKKFLIIDAAMNDLMRPALYNAHHEILPYNNTTSEVETFDIVGPVCETSDTFLKNTEIRQDIKSGDLLAIMTCGAYAASMASTYNSRDIAPEVLVSNCKADLINKGLKLDDLIANETIPDWLK